MRIKNPTDFLTGIAFGAVGLFVSVYAATHYKMGSALRMGPGYFPTWIGGLVAVLGLFLALRALRLRGPALPRMPLRPAALVLGSCILFGYAMKPLGLVLATALLVVLGAAAGHEFRMREATPLAAGLAIFSVAVFVYGLGLPFPLWPEFLE